MKVIVTSLTEKEIERRDYRDALEITIDGKRVLSFRDGEPEDANLSRDFNDCWQIDGIIEQAFLAGLAGEEFSIEHRQEDEF